MEWSLESNDIGPSLSLIPYFVTIDLAMLLACWISPDAPVDMSSRNIFSAIRPPRAETIRSNISLLELKVLSSSGR